MRQQQKSVVIGCIGAGVLTVAALAVITYPAPVLRAGLALLTPIVVTMAFFGSWNSGRCPKCGARRNLQLRTELPANTRIASRADSDGDDVQVDLGWEVVLGEQVVCQTCRHEYIHRDSVFVSRRAARSASEATVLARGKSR